MAHYSMLLVGRGSAEHFAGISDYLNGLEMSFPLMTSFCSEGLDTKYRVYFARSGASLKNTF